MAADWERIFVTSFQLVNNIVMIILAILDIFVYNICMQTLLFTSVFAVFLASLICCENNTEEPKLWSIPVDTTPSLYLPDCDSMLGLDKFEYMPN